MTLPVTNNGQRWNNAGEETIEVFDPDPSWPDQFVTESCAIQKALGPLQPQIEHFGSTAIPKLPAKPIIDIFVIIEDVAVWPHLITPLSNLGYAYWDGNPRTDRMFFVKGMPPFGRRRSHHVHVRTPADTRSELRFRDWLRAHPADAARYAALKQELVKRFAADREAYTAAKSEFIQEILRAAGAQQVGPTPELLP